MTNKPLFHIFTVGFEASIIRDLLIPIGISAEIHFTHGLVGDSRQLPIIQKSFPQIDFVTLSKAKDDSLPAVDYEFLSSLESIGVPTIRSMVQGDRVLRHRPECESLGYATLLALRIQSSLNELQPDIVLGSFDSLHASLSLAVAKSLGIPWVALSFSVIPDNLTGFCKGMTPESLVPIERPYDAELLRQANEVFRNFRSNSYRVLAYQPPVLFRERVKQFVTYINNLAVRIVQLKKIGIDRFVWPTATERLGDIFRRSINTMRLPAHQMLSVPPDNRFAFFPLQMQPESSIDTWAIFYQDQLALIRQLTLAMPADVQFVVKLHFSDRDNYSRSQLMQLLQIPSVKIAHPNSPSRAYLEKAAIVIGIQGTACLEAALLGKPVLIFGDSPYQYFSRTERAKRPDELYEQIQRMLDLPLANDAAIIDAFATYMARYMPGRINDWSKPIEEEDLAKLTECFERLRLYVKKPSCRANWYNEPPFVSAQSLKPEPLLCQF